VSFQGGANSGKALVPKELKPVLLLNGTPEAAFHHSSALLFAQTYTSSLAGFGVPTTRAILLPTRWDGWDLEGFKLSLSIRASEKAAPQVAQTRSV